MLPLYREDQDLLQIVERRSSHFPPHLHKSIELTYVTEGTLELGVGIELYHMEKGDLGIVFPNQIHHFQVFGKEACRSISLLASPSYFGQFASLFQRCEPDQPVVPASKLPGEVRQTLRDLLIRFQGHPLRSMEALGAEPGSIPKAKEPAPQNGETAGLQDRKELLARCTEVADHASVQLMLAFILPQLTLRERHAPSDFDMVYQAVDFIGRHFRENISLTDMAAQLGISQYVLSRIFSGTFHMNFNRYLNRVRLDYACALLTETDDPITEICYDVGFQSQATFNRSFQETYHMTPRTYRTRKRRLASPAG